FKLNEEECGYLAKFHHIISDGWSTHVMTKQIRDYYLSLMTGDSGPDSSEYSYLEYIQQEQEYLASKRFLKNKAFWNREFSDLSKISLLKHSDHMEAERKTYELSADTSIYIKNFIEDNKISLNTFFVTAYLLYLNKTTQIDDLVIGTPVLNRSGLKQKNCMGMFTSTMPFRFGVQSNQTVITMLNTVNEKLTQCFFNQKYPYELLVQDLELKKEGYDHLFNVSVNCYNTKPITDWNGLPVENVEIFNGNQIYSLQVIIRDWGDSGKLVLDFDFRVSDYTSAQIDSMFRQLLVLIHQMLEEPNKQVGKMGLLSQNERKTFIYDFNATAVDYPRNLTIVQLFEQQVKKTPDKIAISFLEDEISYSQLNQRVNRLARVLCTKGVGKEVIVPLLVSHSTEAVVAILAVLKAGGTYLPIDPASPEDRIDFILKNSAASLLLTNFDNIGNINFEGEILHLSYVGQIDADSSDLGIAIAHNQLAYVIYTSGSTGLPKGAMIEHQGLANYIQWAQQCYVTSEDEVFPLYSSLAFDLTITSIFTPLTSGGRIIVYADDRDEYVLYRIIKERKATIIKLTPSHLYLLQNLDHSQSSIKAFIVGGEDLKVSLAERICKGFYGKIAIYNEYGPTETTVGCMIHKYESGRDRGPSVPIGIPAANVQIYILDKNLNCVPISTVGELYISGDGVARGYLNENLLTEEKFVDNPYIEGKRMYKTGDQARFLPSGKIEYIGRTDHQVKIRGYRIELGEIVYQLEQHPAVKNAIVIDREEISGNKYLCAYITNNTPVTVYELKVYLKTVLPEYMIPLHFVELPEIPLTVNGKFDRSSLPSPLPNASDINSCEKLVYKNKKEEILVKAICKVLQLESVGMKHDFLHLGGDSIKAIQISSQISDQGYKLKVKDILTHPILEEMAQYIGEKEQGLADQGIGDGSILTTPIVSWFFKQNFPKPNHYNQSIILDITSELEKRQLEKIFNLLIQHHDALRMNYNFTTGELFYNNNHLAQQHFIEEYDIASLPPSEQRERMNQITAVIKESFDLETDLLIKSCIFILGENTKKLFITAHHMVIDGVSWKIFLEDFRNLSTKALRNRPSLELAPKTLSYQQWAKYLREYGLELASNEKLFWDLIGGKRFVFPEDHNCNSDNNDISNRMISILSEEETQALLSNANVAFRTEPRDLLIVALIKTIAEYTGSEDVIIELEGHGREELLANMDLTRTIGWFTTLYPFYAKVTDIGYSRLTKEIKEGLRNIPNKGIGYGILRYLSDELEHPEQDYIRFNYLGDFTAESSEQNIQLSEIHWINDLSPMNRSTSIIDMNCYIVRRQLNVVMNFNPSKFHISTIQKILEKYMTELRNLLRHCLMQDRIYFTVSDFDTAELTQEELDQLLC
ncbi:amino acid adenylation domain-containing protein, partial [Paenibacillus sp. HN-1]